MKKQAMVLVAAMTMAGATQSATTTQQTPDDTAPPAQTEPVAQAPVNYQGQYARICAYLEEIVLGGVQETQSHFVATLEELTGDASPYHLYARSVEQLPDDILIALEQQQTALGFSDTWKPSQVFQWWDGRRARLPKCPTASRVDRQIATLRERLDGGGGLVPGGEGLGDPQACIRHLSAENLFLKEEVNLLKIRIEDAVNELEDRRRQEYPTAHDMHMDTLVALNELKNRVAAIERKLGGHGSETDSDTPGADE
ncbi:MAG: hypothetical protein LBJ69_02460 [Holosporales bacterium]|jgi:hypothetical protein|nr:hypothetical protein [Holosporales bacterium]